MRPLSLLVLALLVAAEVVSGQRTPQQPTFRLETTLLEVDAAVTDPQGNIVRGLTKDDFTLLDDGKPQPISAFTFFDIPVGRALEPASAGLRVEPDVSTNERPFNGRVYILVLDDLHTTPEWSLQVRNAARRFLERYLGDNDLMTVVYTSRGNVGQDFTNSRSLLLAAISQFAGIRPLEQDARLGPTVQLARYQNALNMLQSIQRLADWADLALPARRKALLLFSEGVADFSPTAFQGVEVGNDASELRSLTANTRIGEAVLDVIGASARGNVSIFPVDVRGLEGVTISNLRTQQNANGHLLLSAMANETGGVPIIRTNDLERGFERIVLNSSSYYALAYEPPVGKRPESFHTITVRVKRPGLQVRARRAYQTPADRLRAARGENAQPASTPMSGAEVSPALNKAINSPVPATDIPVAVFSVPFKTEGATASVLVGIELGELALGEPDASGRLPNNVELSAAVTGLREVKVSRTDRVRLSLTPERAEQAGGGVRVLHRFDLPPGTYQLRVAAKDGNSDRVGSVMHDLVVPDFSKSPLAMSGIVLTSARANDLTTTGDEERLIAVLDAPPAARRQFSPDDELLVFVEIYDKVLRQDIISTRVLDQMGQTVLENVETVSSEALHNERGVYEHQERLRLDDLEPGRYVLKIEVRSQVNPEIRVSREVPFTLVR
ncbi:MAG: VWA domain-containing protein [Vicinamibacterales bacterium]